MKSGGRRISYPARDRRRSPASIVERSGSDCVDLRVALRENFGFDAFHPGQEEVVSRVLRGEDTLAILATGAGKSLTYQMSALLLEGTTVVVSPLIALMKDQLDTLRQHGVHDVIALNSTLSEDQEIAARRAHRGRLDQDRLYHAGKAGGRKLDRDSQIDSRSALRGR